ncbi:TPA: ComEC family competence protein [Candidatus Gracilibacteria bacterium]|nr:ComEC family competence protein [Candidatus Gracilibacteria bacterium]HIQ57307.1 ComEC family competence protein [Candidatus Gracilibacteria bacterium]
MKLTPFYTGLLSFLIGTFIADFIREQYIILFIFLAFPIFYFIKKPAKYLISSIIGFLCGSIFLFLSIPNLGNLQLVQATNNTNTQEISGYIQTFPKIKNDKISFEVNVKNETLLVSKFFKYSKNQEIKNLQYGDFIILSGKIEEPSNSENSNFDYKRFLAKDSIFTIMNNPQIKIDKNTEETNTLIKFWREVFSYRRAFEYNIQQKLPYPENEYALGITLGDESGIPKHIIQDFNDTGLRHLLALSGMNITIIILFLSSLFFFLPTPIRIIAITCSILIFVVLTGASSSVVRAGVMGVVGIIALHSGRKLEPLPILILALSGITLWNPFLLYSDISLQFSVLAVLGLLYIEPLFHKKKLNNSTKINFITTLKTVLTATISAQIAVLPLMIIFFEQVSLISPLTNVLIVPISTLAMILSFGIIIPFFGWIFMIFAYGLLHITIEIAELFAKIPYATVNTENLFSFISKNPEYIYSIQNIFIITYYTVLIVIVIFLHKQKHTSPQS